MDIWKSAFGINEQALAVRSRRLEVLARNIANADTPNYKAQDVDFKAMLKEVNKDYLTATHSKHYAAVADAPDNGMRYRTPFNSSFDGNTVEISVEQAQFGRAAGDYQATLQFLENRIGGIRKALKGE
jgi:flagellar basal-body rod protein FlgB